MAPTSVALSASGSTSTLKPPFARPHTTLHDPRDAKHARLQAPGPQAHPQNSHGARAKLITLLPISRHALFHVRVTIHQLWNVPLVHGSFCVKWKFQSVHSANAAKLKLQEAIGSQKGKEKEKLNSVDDEQGTRSIYTSGSSNLSAPSLSAPSLGSSSSNSSRVKPTALPPSSSKERSAIDFKSESRGRTEFVKLQEHNVKWGHTVDVAVQMSINRETQELQPSELKLVVMQNVVPGDPDAPSHPRLGAVYLNLAEYVDEGPVTRRYLLRQSKTNATLQLTIELTQISGETQFKSPPLPKGEIMAGIANLLDNSSYRNQRFDRSTYLRTNSTASGIGSALRTDSPGTARSSPGLGSGSGSRSRVNSPAPSMEAPLKTITDNIIEAIFNPVPSSSKTPSPFTYYVEPPPPHPHPLATVESSGYKSASASVTSSHAGRDGSLTTHSTSTSTHSHSRTNSNSNSSSGDADVEFGAVEAPSRSASTRSGKSHSTSNNQAAEAAAREKQQRKWWQRMAMKSQTSTLSQPRTEPSPSRPNTSRSDSPASRRSAPANVYITMEDEEDEPVSGLESHHGHGYGGIRRRDTARSIGQTSISSAGSASRWAAVSS